MISFSEACVHANYDRSNYEPPAPKYTYFAYKEGKSQQFLTEQEAKNFSKNIERVTINKDEIDTYHIERREQETKAVRIWQQYLRNEYSYLSDELFDLCYSKAYDEGHSAGYDEVGNCMFEYVEFAEKVLKSKAPDA